MHDGTYAFKNYEFFKSKMIDFYHRGIKKNLIERSEEVINNNGEYILE